MNVEIAVEEAEVPIQAGHDKAAPILPPVLVSAVERSQEGLIDVLRVVLSPAESPSDKLRELLDRD